jgi:hypothetical protein
MGLKITRVSRAIGGGGEFAPFGDAIGIVGIEVLQRFVVVKCALLVTLLVFARWKCRKSGL